MIQTDVSTKKGYRKHHVGRHLIFYRRIASRVEIVRILHENMGVPLLCLEQTFGVDFSVTIFEASELDSVDAICKVLQLS
jgi:hypothetical protein